MVSGNSSAASWSAEATSSAILTFLKPNHFIKWSDHSTLALNSPVLDSSPYFCFKLSYNDFAFSWIILESTDVTFLEQSWTHIRAAFSIRDKKVFLEKYKVFMPYVLARVTVSWGNFFFFAGGGGGGGGGVILLDSSILEWWATIIADLNLQYILNNWTFSCHAMTFLCSLGKLAALLVGLCMVFMMLFKVYISHYEKHVRTRRDHFLLWHTIYWRENLSHGDD